MRIVIDLQGAQGIHRHRSIGAYSMSLVEAMIRNCGEHEIFIALNGLLSNSIEEIYTKFATTLPKSSIGSWQGLKATSYFNKENVHRRQASQLIREIYLAHLKPDMVLISSLFEGLYDDAVTSIGLLGQHIPTAVVLYDLMPPAHYQENPIIEDWYLNKRRFLEHADLLLPLSETSRKNALSHFNAQAPLIANLPKAVGPHFRPLEITKELKESFFKRYCLSRPFVLSIGVVDSNKNIGNLIVSYARLPQVLRDQHQLVICVTSVKEQKILRDIGLQYGLGLQELMLIDFVPIDDLVIFYNLCQVFIASSYYEGHELSILEAISCGSAVLGANIASLPEIMDRKDMLFNPHEVNEITKKLLFVLTNHDFRIELKTHGRMQANHFSLELSAKHAIQAMESAFLQQKSKLKKIDQSNSKKRLAYISPLPPQQSAVSVHSSYLIPALSCFYDVELIVSQKKVSDTWMKSNCKLRSVKWFKIHGKDYYDRILYHFENSSFHKYMFELLEQIPGIIVLHDFFLYHSLADSGRYFKLKHCKWRSELLYAHGYKAVLDSFENKAAPWKYPCNLRILQNAKGVIVHSIETKKLAMEYYGLKASEDWDLLPLIQRPIMEKNKKEKHNPQICARLYFESIEAKYVRNPYHPVIHSLINKFEKDNILLPILEELPELAKNISLSFSLLHTKKQLLLDISTLVERDLKTGIQRVVRSLLIELLRTPPSGFKVEPIYYCPWRKRYHYARNFTLKFLNCPSYFVDDQSIEYYNGDVYLGLDLAPFIVLEQRAFFEVLRQAGVEVKFIVYDLLPLELPHAFCEKDSLLYHRWLEVVVENHGALCISKTTTNALLTWINKYKPNRLPYFKTSWFHLGADIENSKPTLGISKEANAIFSLVKKLPTFLMVGTIEPRKGYQQSLAAFEQLWQEGINVILLIVGRKGWLMDSFIENLLSHTEYSKRLFWLKAVSDECLEELYSSATCLLFTSEGEGFGLPLIEAAQRHLPIITRDIPIFREIAGEAAFYFNGKKASELKTALKEWLSLNKKNIAPSSKNLSWITWKQSTKQLINQLLPS